MANIARGRNGSTTGEAGARSSRSCLVAIDRHMQRRYASRTRAMKNERETRRSSTVSSSASRRDSDGPSNFRRVRRSQIAATLRPRSRSREKENTRGKKGLGRVEEESGEHLSEIGNERTLVNTARKASRRTKGRRREPVTLNSVWIRPRALFAANFSARCRFVQRFYRRIEKIRMLSIFPFPSVSSPRAPFCFHRGAARKKVS